MTRTIQDHQRASQILRFRPIHLGRPLIEISKISGSQSETYVDVHEFAKELDGIVPGFHVSYDPASVAREQEEADERAAQAEALAAAILLVKSNGYDVTKQANPGADYVNSIAQFADGIDGTRDVKVLPSQGGHSIVGAIQDAVLLIGGRDPRDVEVYVEIDRAMLRDELEKTIRQGKYGPAVNDELWSSLWPVVARVDSDGDVILHVTSGDRAQGGA